MKHIKPLTPRFNSFVVNESPYSDPEPMPEKTAKVIRLPVKHPIPNEVA